MGDYKNKLLLNNLKRLYKIDINDSDLNNIIRDIDLGLSKQNKCKVCNKKYKGNNRYYGTSCVKNLYNNADIEFFKDVDDKELFLHSAIILKLNKNNLSKNQINNIVDSYLEKLYFEKIKIETKIIKELENSIIKNTKKIMELNTAYRIYKILRKNKKKIQAFLDDVDKDKLDKTIDDELLKFFRTYFRAVKSVSKESYEVCYYMQYIFWEIVVICGLFKNLKFSSRCLDRSLCAINKEPDKLNITDNDEDVVSLLKKDEKFKEKIKSIIKNYDSEFNKNREIKVSRVKVVESSKVNNVQTETYYYTFDQGDLFYSLHSVKISINGIKNNNKWDLNIILTDTYDFTEILSNDRYNKGKNQKYPNLGNALNDFAVISSQYGVIKPYDINIKFKWSNFDE